MGETFGVSRSKLRAYFHYQPTYYHLHVHFEHVERSTMGDTRERLDLDTVIQNIEMMGDYYQRATLSYQVGLEMPLYKVLSEHGIMTKDDEVVKEVKKPEPEAPVEEESKEDKQADADDVADE